MNEPTPLNPTRRTPEVHLLRAPLARVIAQARFPLILAIRDPGRVAVLQDALRETYPNLSQDQVHSIELPGGQAPNVRQALIWRLADREKDPRWRVSLGVDFVALETSSYESRNDFLGRLRTVVSAVEEAFEPASASRFGLRYIDRLTGEAVDRIGDLIRPDILGIVRSPENPHSALRESLTHLMTEAQFLAQNGARVQGTLGATAQGRDLRSQCPRAGGRAELGSRPGHVHDGVAALHERRIADNRDELCRMSLLALSRNGYGGIPDVLRRRVMTETALREAPDMRTSAVGCMNRPDMEATFAFLIATTLPGSAKATGTGETIVQYSERTAAGPIGQIEHAPAESTAEAVMEIRRRSGLTWEELGDLFDVSRRSVHHWANGKSVTASHDSNHPQDAGGRPSPSTRAIRSAPVPCFWPLTKPWGCPRSTS